jgi:hypothetical protein
MKNDATRYRATSADNFEFAMKDAKRGDDLEKFYGPLRTEFQNKLVAMRPLILKNKFANFVFDYNTAEAVLLSSAILINLAGICFDSSRFAKAKMSMPGIRQEYDSLAYTILVIMFATIIFWFVSMFFDIILVTAPQLTKEVLEFLEKRAGNVAKELQMRRDFLIKRRTKREQKEEVLNETVSKNIVATAVPNLENGDSIQIQNPMLAAKERKKREQAALVAGDVIQIQNPMLAEKERKQREQAALVASKKALNTARLQSTKVHAQVSSKPKTRAVVESDSEDSSGAEDYVPPKPRIDPTPKITAASTEPAAAKPENPTSATTGPITTARTRRPMSEEGPITTARTRRPMLEEEDDDDDDDDE